MFSKTFKSRFDEDKNRKYLELSKKSYCPLDENHLSECLVYNVVTNKSITKNYYEICEPLLNRGRKVQSFPIKSGSSNVNIRADFVGKFLVCYSRKLRRSFLNSFFGVILKKHSTKIWKVIDAADCQTTIVDFEVAVTVLSFSCIVINNFGILLFGEVWMVLSWLLYYTISSSASALKL